MATPNVVPRADQEGGLGTSAKSWGKLFIENPTAGGTAAATISNLDVDQIALDIDANNTTANILDIRSITLTTGKAANIDIVDSGTVTATNSLLELDYNKTGVTGSSATRTVTGFNLEMTDSATNNASGSVIMTGQLINLSNTSNQGNIKQIGLMIQAQGADAADTTGIILITEDGGTDFSIRSSADQGDKFTIATTAAGATTISTIDDDNHAADLTFVVDGFVKFDGAGIQSGGVEIENGSASGNAALLIDNDDTDQVALKIDPANTTAAVIDVTANDITTVSITDFNVTKTSTTNYSNLNGVFGDWDYIKSGNTGDGNIHRYTALRMNLDDTASGNHANSTVSQIGIQLTVDSQNDNGNNLNTALYIRAQDATNNYGLDVSATDGAGADIMISSSANSNDYATITVGAEGATKITTVDADTTAANLSFDVDGEFKINSEGDVNLASDITGTQSSDDVKVVSMGAGYHMIIAEVDVFDANTTDNGVIKQIGTVKIPQYAVIHRTHVIVTELSNISPFAVNLSIGTNSGVAAGTAPANLHEVVGAGEPNTSHTDNHAAASDIIISSGSGNLKKIYKNVKRNDAIYASGELTDDHYLYICSAGTGNGTTDATAGRVLVYLEYFGLD